MIRTAGLTGTEQRYRIRRIFLRRQETCGAQLVQRLTGVNLQRLRAMVDKGELEAEIVGNAWRIGWPQLAGLALDIWPIETIERELGEEAAQVLPALVRTVPVTLRLPRYQVVMLEALAKMDGTGANRRVADALLAIAEQHAEELEERIPGFIAAMHFPEGRS